MKSIISVILAAGQGKRMKSSFPKVLHQLAGKPMISYSIALTKSLEMKKKLVVIGHQAEEIKNAIGDSDNELTFIYQEKQLGTAHAVQQAKQHLTDFPGIILILSADVPLLRAVTIQEMLTYHINHKVFCTLLTANTVQPEGYGRIIRNQRGEITGIIEQRDLKKEQEQIREINAGIYCFSAPELCMALQLVNQNNDQKEYYLTDVIRILVNKGYSVGSVLVRDNEEIIGVNTRADLSLVSNILYQRNAFEHMSKGVTIINPENTFIEDSVKIGQDTIIYPFTIITSGSDIGKFCQIGPYSHIVKTIVGNDTRIYSSVVEMSKIGNRTTIGPYAHIRPESMIGNEVRVGNYVEVKKSFIDQGSKVGHLTYLGDATLGKKVNIGAGTITCNYDGKRKNPTTIQDGVFIGSNNSLVAPVTIGRDSYTAAGSTITTDVPENSLAIARSRQKNIPGWAEKRCSSEKP